MLIFLIVGSPMTYKVTDSFIGKMLGMPFVVVGVPTTTGLLVHALVAGLLTWVYLMTFRV
ncbi:hypothetical protein PBCVNEJV1_516L [Paramecium bursaria Chlorella virus NE-JV-1]|nr:hypothetical protein PBCVNEJV1_516L [Paramecium bursaria Chlorella virus NE-JV-1]